MILKIYRNKTNPKAIGIKFDGHWGTPKVQIEADGNLRVASGVEFRFVSRSREEDFDFNSDPSFVKDYDAELNAILVELLGADASDETERYCVKQLSYAPITVVVTVAGEGDKNAVGNINETVDRLVNYLSSAVH